MSRKRTRGNAPARSRRSALGLILLGGGVLAIGGTGAFYMTQANRGALIQSAEDPDAFLGIDDLEESTTYENPHTATFHNHTYDTLSMTMSSPTTGVEFDGESTNTYDIASEGTQDVEIDHTELGDSVEDVTIDIQAVNSVTFNLSRTITLEGDEVVTETLYPSAEIDVENLVGEVSFLREEDTEDWYTAVDHTEDTLVHVEMDAPADPIAGEQTVEVHVRRTDNSGNEPDVDIVLYEDGTEAELLERNVTVESTTGATISTTFDADSVTDPSEVEFLIEGGATGGRANQRNTVEVGYLTWVANG